MVTNLGPSLVHMFTTFGPTTIFGILLAVAYLLRAAWCLKGGLRGSANLLAWTASLVVWMIGLGWTRGLFNHFAFRYQLGALSFVLLAMMPTEPIRHSWARPLRTRTATALGIVAILIVAGGLAVSGSSSAKASAATLNSVGNRNRGVADFVNLGPDAVPDSHYEGLWFYGMKAGQMRALFATYRGMPTTRQGRGRAVFRHVSVVPLPKDFRDHAPCGSPWAKGSLPPGQYLLTIPPGPPVELWGRYPGTTTQLLAEMPGGSRRRLLVPAGQPVNLQASLRPSRTGSRLGELGVGGGCVG